MRVTATCPERLGGAPDGRPDAHRLADVLDDPRGQRLGLLRARRDDRPYRLRVALELPVAPANGAQALRALPAHGGLEVAVAGAFEVMPDRRRRRPADDRED